MPITPIPYGRQSVSEADIEAVVRVLRSDWLTQGPAVEQFEQAVAAYCGAAYAVAVNSATSALHIACLAAGLSAGETLWTSPNTFVASANCGLYCGAGVDFVDIDPQGYNLSLDELERKLKLAAERGTLPKVLVPVHFAGHPCDMARVAALSRRYGFSVVEDASHAIGAGFRGTRTGSCSFSDLTVFSFHPVKIITCGEGGMVLTNRRDLHEKLIRLRSHGITRDAALMEGPVQGPWYYEQIELGFNYRMNDIQAALGASQLERLDEFVARRRHLAERYDLLLADLPLSLPWRDPEARSSHHLYVVRIDLESVSTGHLEVFEALRGRGIQVNLHYMPVHMQPYYRRLGFKAGDFPQAEAYSRRAISLPIHFGLTEQQQDYVCDALRAVLA